MFNKEWKQSRLAMLTGGLLLLAGVIWLSWPQALPPTKLTLADSPGRSDKAISAGLKQNVLPQVNVQSLGNQERLAFVHQDLLYVAEGEGQGETVRAVSDSGRALAPAWSADGEWLAYIRVTDAETNRGPLWLVRRDGSEAHEVQGLPATLWDWSFSWSPTTNQLVVAVHGYGLWLVPTSGSPELLDPAPWLYRAAWSPDGKYIAYNYCLSGGSANPAGPDDDILCVVDLEQRQSYELVQTDDAGIRLLGWWPDGNGILYWEVSGHGGSVATDGVMIQSVPLSYAKQGKLTTVAAKGAEPWGAILKRADSKSKQPVPLETTLCKQHWTKFTPEDKLLVVAGAGREAWGNKQLILLDPQSGLQEKLATPKDKVALDPAICNTSGNIAFVAASRLGLGIDLNNDAYKAWQTGRTLWVLAANGQLHELSKAGSDIYGPTWSADGKEISYFSDKALWTVAADNKSPAQKIVDLGQCEPNGIYGAHDYNTYFAWYGR